MQVSSKYLDNLQKINLDYVIPNLREGDRILELFGFSGDPKSFDKVIEIVVGKSGRLTFLYENPDRNFDDPIGVRHLERYMRDSTDEQLRLVNEENPFLIKDPEKRKLAIQRGERNIRYMVKMGEKEFEILT